MPINRDVIQGFGSNGTQVKCWKCPNDHMLQLWTASGGGKCDGCHRRIYDGESVMDCRQCNWSLCRTCHPQERDNSLWGAIAIIAHGFNSEINAVVNIVKTCHAPEQEDIEYSEFDVRKEQKAWSGISAYSGTITRGTPTEVTNGNTAAVVNFDVSNSKDYGDSDEHQTATPEEPLEAITEEEPLEDLIDIGQTDLLDLSDPVVAPTSNPVANVFAASSPPPTLPTQATVTAVIAVPSAGKGANCMDINTDLLVFDP